MASKNLSLTFHTAFYSFILCGVVNISTFKNFLNFLKFHLCIIIIPIIALEDRVFTEKKF